MERGALIVVMAAFLLFSFSGCRSGNKMAPDDKSIIKIGLQEWSAKNLDTPVFRNGDPIPEAKTDEEWKRAAIEGKPAWSYYDNNPENGRKEGKLYNWYAINDLRGICPEGWHVPSDKDWNEFTDLLGQGTGAKLKSIDGWENQGSGTDGLGFSVYPAGIRYHSGIFDDRGTNAYYWTSSGKEKGWYGKQGASGRFFNVGEEVKENDIVGFRKGSGMSVRCVRRGLYEGYEINPSNPPNEGSLFVDHEATGRSGHVGNAITECKNGDILAFYVNSSGVLWGGHGAAGWTEYKRSTDGGKTWSDPIVFEYSKKVWDENKDIIEDYAFNSYYTAYVTSVITAPNGTLIAFVSRRLPILPAEKQRKPVYLISTDNGNTWGEPKLVDEKASFEDVTLVHSDAGVFVYEGNIYAVFIGGGSHDYNEGNYSFYMSDDNGESFKRISSDLFAGTSSGKHVSANVLDDGRFIVYSFNPKDEHNLPYVISEDKGLTWSEVQYTYMEKRMRNAQVCDKIGDYYFMTGRSGNSGDDPSCLVLYTSEDGIHWDRGVFLNKVQIGLDSYTANEIIGKYNPDKPKRLLIQSSIGYSGLSTNVVHWWIENIKGDDSHSGISQSGSELIDPSAKLELITDTLQFAEGPVSDRQGNIYFTDIRTSRIYMWSVDRELKIYRDPSGRANGLRFDFGGNLLACEGASRRLTSTAPDGKVTVLADQYNGKKLNSPNDLWVDSKGGIYFTDPRYSDARWIWVEKDDPNTSVADSLYKEEQDTRGLYYLPSDGKPLRRVAEDLINPNGVIGTSDGKKLYVSDTEKREIYVFDILPDGSLTNRNVFIPEYSDGLTLDEKNNLYLTNGGIQIYTPEGNLITTIDIPYKSSNVCFGGKDHKTLIITARKGIYSFPMKVSGQ